MQIPDSHNQKNSLFNAMSCFVRAVNNMDRTVMVPSLLRDVPLSDDPKAGCGDATGFFQPDGNMYSSYLLLKSIRDDMEWGVLQSDKRHREGGGVTAAQVVAAVEEDEEDLEKQFHFHLNGLHAVLSELTRKADTLTNRYKQEVGCTD